MARLNVGILSSYNTQCGIAEYTQGLVRGLWKNGCQPTVFCNHSTGDRKLGDYPSYAKPVFWVWHWEKQTGIDIDTILENPLDVLHIQYHGMFFKTDELNELMKRAKDSGTKIIVTFHDTAILSDVDKSLIDVRMAHRLEIPHDMIIPFGVPYKPPVIATFGIGRSRVDKISELCGALGYELMVLDGKKEWLSREQLHAKLKTSDAIVLWYDDVHVLGSSQAARTAIATRRPVFLNSDVGWFKDLIRESNSSRTPYTFFRGREDLERYLLDTFKEDAYLRRYSWDNVAKLFLEAYNG